MDMYNILVKEAFSIGCLNVLYLIFWVSLLLILIRSYPKFEQKSKDCDDQPVYALLLFLYGLAGVIIIVFGVFVGHEALQCFSVPEYWALQQLESSIK